MLHLLELARKNRTSLSLQCAALYIYVNCFIFQLAVDVLMLSALKYPVCAEYLSG